MSDPSNGKKSSSQGRFQSLETASHEKQDELQETTPTASLESALREQLAAEEHEALGHLAESMVELRDQEAPGPTMTEWRGAMKTIYEEVSRTDLTLDEKKLRLHDIYLARGKSKAPWIIAALVALGVAAALVYTLVG